MNLAYWLDRTAERDGARPALFRGHEAIADYAAFRDRAGALAGALADGGVGPGDRVAIFMKNCPDYLVCLWAIWTVGAAAVPVNAKLHPREAAWILEDAGALCAFVSGAEGSGLDSATAVPMIDVEGPDFPAMCSGARTDIAHRGSDDLAWLFYTSGTTGRPKGVMITHGMLETVSLCYLADVDRVDPDDAALYAAPMSHGAGLYALIHVLKGCRHVVPASGGFDANEILDLSGQVGPVSMFMAPTMVRRLTDRARARGDRAEGLRTVVYAGGPMYEADILDAVDWFGPKFVQIYGQGECPMGITALSREDVADRSHPRWRERLGSVGRAQAAVEVAIGGADGEFLDPGQTGEILVRGRTVMPGYWRNPEATAKTLVDGWLRTGDVGRLDAEGYLTLTDRSKDVIISGGSNIYPREVEEVLLTHPAVHEVSVVGQRDPEWGEIVVAFVVPVAGAEFDPDALDRHCRDRIARFKRPKRYRQAAELPKNNYGKVLKTDLRRMLEEDGEE